MRRDYKDQSSLHKCGWCKYWTQRKIGDCSQYIETTEGIPVKAQTEENYGCNTYEYDTSKMKLTFWQDGDGNIHHSGTTSKTYLYELKKKIDEMYENFGKCL